MVSDKGRPGILTGEYEIAVAGFKHRLHDLVRRPRQRNAVFATTFHSFCRHRPYGSIEVKFLPARAEHFTSPRGRENGKLERRALKLPAASANRS